MIVFLAGMLVGLMVSFWLAVFIAAWLPKDQRPTPPRNMAADDLADELNG